MEALTGIDQLSIRLTGGADNRDPALSLGGAPSDYEYRQMSFLVADPIPGLRILQVYGTCGEGEATLEVNADGNLVFTAPDGSAGGTPVAIDAGETKVVLDSLGTSGVKVYRAMSSQPFAGIMTLTLKSRANGVLAMDNVEHLERVYGRITYRCVMVTNQGDSGAPVLSDILLSVDGASLQSGYELGMEIPDSIGEVQTVPDEETAPEGVDFERVTESSEALDLGILEPGESVAVWIKKTMPASRATFTDLPADEDAYVMKDFGADHFSGGFVHRFTVRFTNVPTNSYSFYLLSNLLDSPYDIDSVAAGDFLGVSLYGGAGSEPSLWLEECATGSRYYVGIGALSLETDYYMEFERDESVGAYGTIYMRRYSDKERTVLLSSHTLALHKKTDFRYLQVVRPWGSGSAAMSGHIESLTLDEGETWEDLSAYIVEDPNGRFAVEALREASPREDAALSIQVTGSEEQFELALPDFYRVADEALEKYELYVGEDALPDFEASDQPVATSAALPFNWTPSLPPSGSVVYNLVVRKRNRYNLLSFNQKVTKIEVDSAGEEVLGPLTAPTVEAHPAADLQVVVMASYQEVADQNPADSWKVWLKAGSPPDPDLDTPDYEGDFSDNPFGAQRLQQVLGDFESEDVVYVIVAVVRDGDGEEARADAVTVTIPETFDLDPEDQEIV